MKEGEGSGISFYLGTFRGDGTGFILQGVRVFGGSINPKANLRFNPDGGLKNTTLTMEEIKNIWNNRQACVILGYGDSRVPMITAISIFNSEIGGKSYKVERKFGDESI